VGVEGDVAFEEPLPGERLEAVGMGIEENQLPDGGEGEDAFRSFLNEAMAKQIVHRNFFEMNFQHRCAYVVPVTGGADGKIRLWGVSEVARMLEY
jgi:hypothetical protein